MAPAAVDPAAQLDEVVGKPPPGVVLPPRDIRAIVEKTAGYVVRNGATFEERIHEKEFNNPKFSFLGPKDAYFPFYQWRLSEIREGRGTAVSAGRAGEAAANQPAKPKGPEPPPDFHFSARMPNISALDLDVVKLTALFVAKNGRSWMTQLSQREAGNYQFDFLRPQHSLYQFFTRLIDQYTELLNGGTVEGGKLERARIAELERNVCDRFHLLGRAKQRAEWVKYQEMQKAKKEEEVEAEKMAYAQIDWHDFSVVGTIVFTEEDESIDLPPPTSLSDLQSASLEQKAMMSLAPHNMRIEEAMPTADDPYYDATPAPPVQLPPAAGQYPQGPIQPEPLAYRSAQDEEEQARIRERAAERERAQQAQAAAKAAANPMRIREGGTVPRAMARRKNVQMALCPNCKQQIPYDELEQHMKVELLDPNWRKQKEKERERQATTNLSTDEVAKNLKRLASQRTDVFDAVTGQPLNEDEQARQKRAASGMGAVPNAPSGQ
ncbi:Surp module [Trichodelitschia bisporula]|uniref:Surp module n=1 Tax=Trichodelitschia bisporula TaxID=703511 RepID=A0A6G1HWS3_9PEZI|nr:Surp module [Trichodelitschia bisporula]